MRSCELVSRVGWAAGSRHARGRTAPQDRAKPRRVLISIGMLLQFHAFAVVHVVLLVIMISNLFAMNREDDSGDSIAITLTVFSLAVLGVIYLSFLCLYYLAPPRIGVSVMIAINALHAGLWLCFGIPFTLLRLLPSTILYIVALTMCSQSDRSNDAG